MIDIPDIGGIIDSLLDLFDGWFEKGYLYMFLGVLVLVGIWIFFF